MDPNGRVDCLPVQWREVATMADQHQVVQCSQSWYPLVLGYSSRLVATHSEEFLGEILLKPPETCETQNGCVWKCCVPLCTQWLMIIIPMKWLFHWEYSLFSDKPKYWNTMGKVGKVQVSTTLIRDLDWYFVASMWRRLPERVPILLETLLRHSCFKSAQIPRN